MSERNGYWHHDGSNKRPFALLTSGKVSNFYANCSVITKNPRLLAQAAEHLLKRFAAVKERPQAYCGSALAPLPSPMNLQSSKKQKPGLLQKMGRTR